jgi:hypothetical protein
MKQILICTKCKSKLSEAVQILKEGELNYPVPDWRDESPMSAKGIALMSMKAMQYATKGPKAYLDFTPQYWMRLDDILSEVGKIEDDRVWQGCCGPSGDYGPNRKCRCGEPVGSERNDCWTPKVFVPDPKATRWQNEKS